MDRVNWAQVAAFGVVALLVLLFILSFLPFGWGGGWWGPGGMMGWMMGPGVRGGWSGATVGGNWGALGWFFSLLWCLIPLGFLALLVLGGVWLFQQVSSSGSTSHETFREPAAEPVQRASSDRCPSCGRDVQADWQVCPYCGQGLA